MIKPIDLNEQTQLEKLFHLQQQSYQVEAGLIQFYDIPPLKESIETLKNSNEAFYGYWIGEELAGAIASIREEKTYCISRMMVSPPFFRRGIAYQLAGFLKEILPNETLTVSTGKENLPARRLYEKLGFKHQGDLNLEVGVTISRYEYRGEEHV